MKIITCEQVSDGHTAKICDQIADAVVTDCLCHDPASRVAIEVLIKDAKIVIAGELTSSYRPDYRRLTDEVLERLHRPGTDDAYSPWEYLPEVIIFVREQSPDIALGVDRGGAGDQGIRHVLYNCSASRPSIASETKEDTIEPVTETLSLTADPRADGLVKARTGDTTTEETYNNWYQSVYVPVEATEG